MLQQLERPQNSYLHRIYICANSRSVQLKSWTGDASALVTVQILSRICSSNNMLKTSDILFAALVADNITLATACLRDHRTRLFSSRFYNEIIFISIRIFNGKVIFFRINFMIGFYFRSISCWNKFFIKFAEGIIRITYIALKQYPKNVIISDLLAGYYFNFLTFKNFKKDYWWMIQICNIL